MNELQQRAIDQRSAPDAGERAPRLPRARATRLAFLGQIALLIVAACMLSGTNCYVAVSTHAPTTVVLHVHSTTPHHAATRVDPTVVVHVHFSGAIDRASVASAVATLSHRGKAVPCDVQIDPSGHSIQITPRAPLAPTRYEVAIDTTVRGADGGVLAEPYRFAFEVGQQPPQH